MFGLLGEQAGYTNYLCFLFFWNGRADDQHYSGKQRPLRRIVLPSLHIKHGLAKKFIKILKSDNRAFCYV